MTDPYDPFSRGPHPVGVRTADAHDPERDRTLPVEVWYPADRSLRGGDLDERRDQYVMVEGLPAVTQDAIRDAAAGDDLGPGIVFSHGLAGHRRQTTHLCTHLASHGYVVAAADHLGNTTSDVMAAWAEGGGPEAMVEGMRQSMDDRPLDVSTVVDALLGGGLGVTPAAGPVGIAGHSFGGWTSLYAAGRDDRIGSVLALAPAVGSDESETEQLAELGARLDLAWSRHVPILVIAADEDSVIPLSGIETLIDRSASIDRLVVIVNSDHFHFVDRVEVIHNFMAPMMGGQTKTIDEFVAGEDAYTTTNGLGLVHFDASLRSSPAAVSLADADPVQLLAGRGITLEVVTH